MTQDYIKRLEESREELIQTLRESVQINSVGGEAVTEPDGTVLPFGRGVEAAFQHMLGVGRAMGFETFDAHHYGGHIEWKVPGAVETFGIAAHLDVVPEGTGWTHGPFDAEIEDGRMYGRGTADDKGPLVAALYAVKAIKDAGLTPNKNIRLILGLDEETGMAGIDEYFAEMGMPDLGFTPDAAFPMINGEKGIMVFELAQKLNRRTGKETLSLRKLNGGTAYNAVPGTAKAVLVASDPFYYSNIKDRAAAYASETGYKLSAKRSGSSLCIEATGKAAHGAYPQNGLNAVSILMGFLGTLHFDAEDVNDFIAFYNDHIGFEYHGESIGCGLEDEPSGKLIFNVGVAEINDDLATVTVNIRYPVTCTGEDVYNGINAVLADTDIGLVKARDAGPIYMDLSDPFAASLLASYVEETGDTETKPIVMGGGTYAKKFRRMLAFGAMFPGDEDRMHQADEYISLDRLMQTARIYAHAIYKNCCE
ncbi:MAG: dipeptidase PepV [Mogibacterium sp.]|nr:dipeptidase PepV [Mogibacterium sp.]